MQRLPPPFRVIALTITDWWDAWLSLALINFVWAMCCLTIILAPPATLSLYAVTNELVHGQTIGLSDFIAGIRQHFVRAWLWALLNIVIAFLAYNGLRFYGQLGDLGSILQIVILVILIGWLIVQFYALPYWMEQEDKRFIVALRNGSFTALASPFYTLTLLIFGVLVGALSIVLVALVFLGGVCILVLLGTRAVFERLETFGIRQREAEQASESAEPQPLER